MCNRVIQKGKVIKPTERLTVLLKGPNGEFELPFEAIFGGPARSESRQYWIKREGAEEVRVPEVQGFGEADKATGRQNWERVAEGSWLEGLLLPVPAGKDYRLLKVVTQPATAEQVARLGNDRAPVVHAPAIPRPLWGKADAIYLEFPPVGVVVWATDGVTVRPARWLEDRWEDEAGQVWPVTSWLPLEESPDRAPGLPFPWPGAAKLREAV